MDLSWNPTRTNASTFNTNTATPQTAHDGTRTRAGSTSGERRDAAIANTTVVMIPDRCSRSASTQTPNVVQNWRTTAVATSVTRAVTASVTRASNSARTMLPTVTQSSVGSTPHPDRVPVTVAPTARR